MKERNSQAAAVPRTKSGKEIIVPSAERFAREDERSAASKREQAASSSSSSSGGKRVTAATRMRKKGVSAPSVASVLAHADKAQASRDNTIAPSPSQARRDNTIALTPSQDPFASATRRHAADSIFSVSEDSNGGNGTQSSDFPSTPPSPAPKKRKATTLILPSKAPSNTVFAAEPLEAPSRGRMMLDLPDKQSVAKNDERKKEDPIPIPKRVQDLKTCPFCGRKMPPQPSALLVKLLQPWLNRLHNSEQINVTDTASSCARHEEELDVIPRGLSRGWPSILDWSDLTRRVNAHKDTLFNKYILLPEESYYMRRANELKLYRKKSIMQTPEALSQTRAGYYGEVGWDLFRSILLRWLTWNGTDESPPIDESTFLDTVHPLSTWDFVDLVLMPELTCLLIKEDYKDKLTDEEARKVKEESAEFGLAMFPMVDDASLSMGASLEVEEREEDRVPYDEPVLVKSAASKASTARVAASQPASRTSASQSTSTSTASRITASQPTSRTAASQPTPSKSIPRPHPTSSAPSIRPRPQPMHTRFPPDDDDDFFNKNRQTKPTRRVAAFDDLLSGKKGVNRPPPR